MVPIVNPAPRRMSMPPPQKTTTEPTALIRLTVRKNQRIM